MFFDPIINICFSHYQGTVPGVRIIRDRMCLHVNQDFFFKKIRQFLTQLINALSQTYRTEMPALRDHYTTRPGTTGGKKESARTWHNAYSLAVQDECLIVNSPCLEINTIPVGG